MSEFGHESSEIAEKQEVKKIPEVTPGVARVLYFNSGKDDFPKDATLSPEELSQFSKVDFVALEKASMESRKSYWQTKNSDFADRNSQWNTSLAGWINNHREDTDITSVLSSLGIDFQDPQEWEKRTYEFETSTGKREVELVPEIEEFRVKYSQEGSMEKFIAAIAKDCTGKNSQDIDISLLSRRLNSASELLSLFGKEYAIDKLVKDFAISQSLLSKNDPAFKQDLSQSVRLGLRQELSDPKLDSGIKKLIETRRILGKTPKEISPDNNDLKNIMQKLKSNTLTPEGYHEKMLEEAELQYELIYSDQVGGSEEMGGLGIEIEEPKEFKKILDQLENEGHISSSKVLFEHEMAHYRVALEKGLAPRFHLVMTSDSKIHASTSFERSKKGKADKESVFAVFTAPGLDGMSEYDLASVGLKKEDVEQAKSENENLNTSEKEREKILSQRAFEIASQRENDSP